MDLKITTPCIEQNSDKERWYYEGKSRNKKIQGIDGILEITTSKLFVIMHKRRGESREIKVKQGDIVGRISSMVELDEYENEEDD